MHRLRELVGQEHECDSLNRRLRDFARSQQVAAVGGMLVTCADECEREAAESFQQWFVDSLLPEWKPWCKGAFRVANLGARYEWGGLPVAEQHFALPETKDGGKLLLVSLNSHVAMERHHDRPRFGSLDRYGCPSTFCGALHALLDGKTGPAMEDLRTAFASEGKSRLEMLRDPSQVDPTMRALYAALVNARLQARRAIVEIQSYRPTSPTLYVVVPRVTLNQKQRDTEIVVGVYLADYRGPEARVQYFGLEDDPRHYEVTTSHGRIRVSDRSIQHPRDARDHREQIFNAWLRRREREALLDDQRLHNVARQIAEREHEDPNVTFEILKTTSLLLLELAPVPFSILLFAKGIAGAHHLYTMYRLAGGSGDEGGAKDIVREFLGHIDQLSPDQARTLIEAMADHHGLSAARDG